MPRQRPHTAGRLRSVRGGQRAPAATSSATRPNTSPGKRTAAAKREEMKAMREAELQNIFRAKHDHEREKCDFMHARIVKSDQQISKLKQEILAERKFRRRLGGTKACNLLKNNAEKRVRYLENRLNKLTNRENGTESSNSLKMVTVDELRRKSISLRDMNIKLRKDFKDKQKQMAEIMDLSNDLYKTRSEAVRKLERLRARKESEKVAFDEEWESLGKLIKTSAAISDYVKTSALKRKEKELKDKLVNGNLDPEEEAKIKSKLSKLTRKVNRTQAEVQHATENIASAKEAFGELEKMANTPSLDAIVKLFVKREDENFASFNIIQRITDSIDLAEKKLKNEKERMEKYKKDQGDSESSRKRLLFQMEAKLEKLTELERKGFDEMEQQNAIFSAVARAVDDFFLSIGCPDMEGMEGFRKREKQKMTRRWSSKMHSVRNMHIAQARKNEDRVDANIVFQLGNEVTEQNLMIYLGTCEQQLNDIINNYSKVALSRQESGSGSFYSLRSPISSPKHGSGELSPLMMTSAKHKAPPALSPEALSVGPSLPRTTIRHIIELPETEEEEEEVSKYAATAVTPVSLEALRRTAENRMKNELATAASTTPFRPQTAPALTRTGTKSRLTLNTGNNGQSSNVSSGPTLRERRLGNRNITFGQNAQ